MKEKKHKNKDKKHKKKHKKDKRRHSTSSSNSSEEWVEKSPVNLQEQQPQQTTREDWMSMTGMIRTYTIDDVKSCRKDKVKDKQETKQLNSYNPGTSGRELNPYWKDGGTGLPGSHQPKSFMKPSNDDDYYRPSRNRKSDSTRDNSESSSTERKSKHYSESQSKYDSHTDIYINSRSNDNSPSKNRHSSSYERPNKSTKFMKPTTDDNFYSRSNEFKNRNKDNDDRDLANYRESANWKKKLKSKDKSDKFTEDPVVIADTYGYNITNIEEFKVDTPESKRARLDDQDMDKYLTDEKMNKLGAKIIKAEIMGDTDLVNKLKAKLEAAREYRNNNPNAGKTDETENIMLMASNSKGDYRPLTKSAEAGDPRSKGGKKKAITHNAGERMKYFSNDDRFSINDMFEQEKYGTNYDNDAQLANVSAKHKNPNDDIEDIFTEEISKNKNLAKEDEKTKHRAIKEHEKLEKSLEGCEYCIGSKNMLRHLMISCGSKVYLAVPAKRSLVKGHCILTTVQHATCSTSIDEDVWEEIMEYRKALTRMFNSRGEDVVFFEMATKLNKYPHMLINCVPLPRDVGDTAAIYFKKALLECETEWSVNKKVIDLKGKNVRRGVPKGLPYFWVDFAMDPGFAHVIEDQQLFPKNFAEEIIGGILDLDHGLWKNPKREYGDVQRKKVLEFIEMWRKFEIKK